MKRKPKLAPGVAARQLAALTALYGARKADTKPATPQQMELRMRDRVK